MLVHLARPLARKWSIASSERSCSRMRSIGIGHHARAPRQHAAAPPGERARDATLLPSQWCLGALRSQRDLYLHYLHITRHIVEYNYKYHSLPVLVECSTLVKSQGNHAAATLVAAVTHNTSRTHLKPTLTCTHVPSNASTSSKPSDPAASCSVAAAAIPAAHTWQVGGRSAHSGATGLLERAASAAQSA